MNLLSLSLRHQISQIKDLRKQVASLEANLAKTTEEARKAREKFKDSDFAMSSAIATGKQQITLAIQAI